jgi:hypothetical protein
VEKVRHVTTNTIMAVKRMPATLNSHEEVSHLDFLSGISKFLGFFLLEFSLLIQFSEKYSDGHGYFDEIDRLPIHSALIWCAFQ